MSGINVEVTEYFELKNGIVIDLPSDKGSAAYKNLVITKMMDVFSLKDVAQDLLSHYFNRFAPHIDITYEMIEEYIEGYKAEKSLPDGCDEDLTRYTFCDELFNIFVGPENYQGNLVYEFMRDYMKSRKVIETNLLSDECCSYKNCMKLINIDNEEC